MGDEEARSMDFSAFLRHGSLGLPRIIKFMNEWYEHRNQFRGLLLLRYEDCIKVPEAEFSKLLEYLSIPVDVKTLRLALASSVDTTRKIEEGGLARNQELADEISRGPLYFETAHANRQSIKRYTGDEVKFVESFTADDLLYIDTEMKKVNAVFGYGPRLS
jgi:hypothetical protein